MYYIYIYIYIRIWIGFPDWIVTLVIATVARSGAEVVFIYFCCLFFFPPPLLFHFVSVCLRFVLECASFLAGKKQAACWSQLSSALLNHFCKLSATVVANDLSFTLPNFLLLFWLLLLPAGCIISRRVGEFSKFINSWLMQSLSV